MFIASHKAIGPVPGSGNSSPRDTEQCEGVRKDLIYTLTWSKDHLHIKDHLLIKTAFTCPHVYTFHAIEPAHKDHICIRATVPRVVFNTRFAVYANVNIICMNISLRKTCELLPSKLFIRVFCGVMLPITLQR